MRTAPESSDQRAHPHASDVYNSSRAAAPARDRQSREHSPDPSSILKPDNRFYSSRYSLPTQTSSTKTYPSSHRGNYKRQSWPPSPAVEDERISLAKEANPPRLTDSDIIDAPVRGILDQQPILLEADATFEDILLADANAAERKQAKLKERLDQLSGRHVPATTQPNDSGDRKARWEDPVVDEIYQSRRKAAPYSYAGTGKEFLSASDKKTVPPAFERKDFALPDKKPPELVDVSSDALRGQGKPRGSSFKTSRDSSVSSVTLDDHLDASKRDASRKSAPYSYSRHDAQPKDDHVLSHEPVKDEPRPRLAKLKAEALAEPRRNSDSANTMLRPRLEDLRKGPPSMHPFLVGSHSAVQSPATTPISRTASQSYFSHDGLERSYPSRPASPAGLSAHVSKLPPSPPRSPRIGTSSFKSDSPSSLSSRPTSRSVSRASSPKPSEAYARAEHGRVEETIRRAGTFPYTPEERGKRSSRLASSSETPFDDRDVPPMRSTSFTSASHLYHSAGSLPYPVDDLTFGMPSEDQHKFRPSKVDSPMMVQTTTRSGTEKGHNSLEAPRSRPRAISRHTHDGGLPVLAVPMAATVLPLRDSLVKQRHSPTSSSTVIPPAPCPRMQSSRNYNDWYTLEGCSNFDICPSCLDNNFADTKYERYFKRASRKDPARKVKCDFSSPWIRLAWLLTQREHIPDLSLLYVVAKVSATEPKCPGSHDEAVTWYTVSDRHGDQVNDFVICAKDVKMVEKLMPSFKGYFERNRHSSGRKRKCDLRTESRRFSEYLDLLTTLDEDAEWKKKAPDMNRFAELARLKCQMRECSRDDMLVDVRWHFIPKLPDFTVCEECYSSVVWPAIADGSSVADLFNRTPQTVAEDKRKDSRHGDLAMGTAGTSCQLYSPRMRKVFRKAVQNRDFDYLVRRAQERKDVERELQARFTNLNRLTQDLKKMGSRDGPVPDRSNGLQAEFNKIAEEWRDWE